MRGKWFWLEILLVFLFLVVLGFAGYFGYQYYQYLQNTSQQQELVKIQQSYHSPLLHTESLPEGKVGEKYQAEILASYAGSHEELAIKLKNPPQGLNLGDCNKEFDIAILKSPNTFSKCILSGVPTEAQEYNLEISASVQGPLGFVEMKKDVILTISK
jgi:hypothetical protein